MIKSMQKQGGSLRNVVRATREQRGWSQQELAQRSGLSRTGISAIEAGRLIPSTAAALALAAAFCCRVEDLFVLGVDTSATWAWSPSSTSGRYLQATIGERQVMYPMESNPLGCIPHDAIWQNDQFQNHALTDPAQTCVVACCDPAVGLLASEYTRQTSYRMIVFTRPGLEALDLLSKGLIHAAGLHFSDSHGADKNKTAAAGILSQKFKLLKIADWDEGLALAPGLSTQKIEILLKSKLRWIGREKGSGAYQMLQDLSGGLICPEHIARDHRGVAQAIRNGFVQAGISLRLPCEEEGVEFLSLKSKAYELCTLESTGEDPRILALQKVAQSLSYRRLLSELPGYECKSTGEIR